jgi:hypothetical protein
MKKPPQRPDLPRRRSNNDKRRLLPTPAPELIAQLLATATYQGSPKHKINPHIFNLPPYNGQRGDETLCDAHAGFTPAHMATLPALLERGIEAGLIGASDVLWTVADSGWIFEARLTNVDQAEYHGYPVRSSEPIGESVYLRFAAWAEENGTAADKLAATNCKALYGFK